MTVKSHPKSKFTPEEDIKLNRIVQSMKTIDWNSVSNKMGNRNPRQCKDRWTKYLCPNINMKKFTLQEDIDLLELYDQFGPKWVLISKCFNNRSDVAIKSRFMVLKRRGMDLKYLKEIRNNKRKPSDILVKGRKTKIIDPRAILNESVELPPPSDFENLFDCDDLFDFEFNTFE
ncbi:Myb-like DNA-binding domain containing protein [Trichomonas vaginalis G3]|uniref:Myb-like DNA-binding domain containing protein n=1 Tax=Trichomonas vaginalis (strain ATCC PRA-98 / G3) TaxID=412133 RepID=A2E116_TRIV3|nr:RNA polymerase II transcription regulator recruiting protein [Trichomonas vaginalis G3]EAY13648.1 Myb-like DNA-binding domain containing protein [Trichomonas vaginalis G3]KAI5529922.1 RNA polymerase II transcription regulator recruiting protein [Trichomonas vaginalis G3]|eukprot:XP_001325871.1 Myb-like DNA-binding domain containing protein [Trichomonas vaginalis G3]